jgi:hypothetical protein
VNKLKLIAFLIVLAFTGLAFKCSSGGPQPTFTGALSDKYQAKTAKGADVHSGKKIDPQALVAVDAGLDRLFEIAAAPPNNYSGFTLNDTYTIWLLTRAAACVNPGFTEIVYSPAWPDGYDETYTDDPANHWDKDPRPGSTLLCVAGFMALKGGGNGVPGSPGMGVVDDLAQLPTIVRYEGEHNLLLQVDSERYAATQYHYGANGGHPILGDGNSFKSESLPKGYAFIDVRKLSLGQGFAASDVQIICVLVTN